MASQAVYVCYFCRLIFVLSTKHQCQKECHKATALHRDFCPRCKRNSLKSAEAQFAKPARNDAA